MIAKIEFNPKDKKIFQESFFALSVTMLGGLLTGLFWSSFFNSFIQIAGIIALIPVISEMRGNISGIFTSRLGTGLHIGFIKPSFTQRSKELNNSINMNIILSLLIPLWVAIVVFVFTFLNNNSTPLIRFIIIGIVGSLIAGSLQIVLTLSISFLVFKRGMDPDIIVYPTLSLIADIITVLSIFVAFNAEKIIFPFLNKFVQAIFELIFVTIFLAFLFIIFSRPIRSKFEFELLNLLGESVPILLLTVPIGAVVGIILDENIPYQGIILILPLFMAFTGATGSIVGSTFTTAYHLGQPLKHLYLNIPIIILTISAILGIILGVGGFLISTSLHFSLPTNYSLLSYVILCLLTALITAIFSIINALILGNITFKRGIDADNVIVPITSTIGDLVAILSFVMLLAIIQ